MSHKQPEHSSVAPPVSVKGSFVLDESLSLSRSSPSEHSFSTINRQVYDAGLEHFNHK